jgi:hypothetical protein
MLGCRYGIQYDECMRVFVLLIATALQLAGQTDPTWKRMEFLLGKWTGVAGEKDTQIGAGQGAFSFELELSQKIVVRRNNASYDSGAKHDDLMVIYFDGPKDAPRAIYFDSEGHVIRYNVTFPAANRAVFESDGSQPGPKYRLTYWMDGALLKGTFEVAPPGSEYKNYMSWTSKR